MSICATSLVTHGMISCQIAQNQLASCDRPDVTGVVEVRPRIRSALSPEADDEPEPKITTVAELKPRISGRTEAEPSPDSPPKNVSAQELKPSITKVREE